MPAAVHAHRAIKKPALHMPGRNWLPEFDVPSGARCREHWHLRGPLRERMVKHRESIPALAEIGNTSG